jgi:hypothetical protein
MSKKRNKSAKPLRAVRVRKTQSRKFQQRGVVAVQMYDSPRTIMPPEFDTNLKYLVQDVVTNVAGFGASIRFTNNAYDVDPALASTAMPGFAEFAAFYARFRTLKVSYKFSCFNQEAFGLTLIHGFSNASIASGSLGITYAGNPLFKTTCIGAQTGNSTRVCAGSASVSKIVGTVQPLYDDLYTGSTTSNTLPTASHVHAYIGYLSANAGTAAGLAVTVEITLRVRFYKPNFLLV